MTAAARTAQLRCGSDIREALAAAGIAGDFIEYANPVCQGPVPGRENADGYRRTRAAWIAATWSVGATEADLHRQLAGEDAALDGLSAYDRVTLWFEHDPYDQTVLAKILSRLADRPDVLARLRLIAISDHPTVPRFRGLGQLTPDALAGLQGTAVPVSAEMAREAAEFWRAFAAPEPGPLARLVAAGSPHLPLMAPAFRRLLEEYPWTANGLSLTEQLALRAVAGGAGTAGRVFFHLQDSLEPMPFLGDLMFEATLNTLADAGDPALVRSGPGWKAAVSLTGTGRALLDGAADWAALNGLDRWIGGVHLTGGAPWRWDPDGDRIVRTDAAG